MTMISALTLCTPSVRAEGTPITLRLHNPLPPMATLPAKVMRPWGERLKAASGGRLKVEFYDAMALGGRPSDVIDQARDGVVDLSFSIVGYTPGRFPRTEVFELPFMMTDPVSTSLAFWEMMDTDFSKNEFASVKVLAAWVHGPGVLHTVKPVMRREDLKGMTIRGPSRTVNALLTELGATPIGMPVQSLPEALSKGVVGGATLPWETTPSVRLAEMVKNHTELAGPEAMYTATIVLVMNKERYAALPADLRAILDAETGAKLSGLAAKGMLEADAPARVIAVKAGNTITRLDEAETERWKTAAKPVTEAWIKDMKGKGIDGQALIQHARDLIAQKSK
ncbi:TRAP transporter substrate-binding protein [Rhizobium pusense]|uniref:TRAP transporter substrate-binding protein n=1 Tax=Agrobacterium pusense TaxID=648995 RepID=UPI001FCDC316|nr:TRAP transporter substrate-binding protein [Agrobacterium pusense]MCJ2877396.1 TRAP transporter substrate-binding protein [Agrobacterium pusense]